MKCQNRKFEKFDLREYLPIPLGWLKSLVALLFMLIPLWAALLLTVIQKWQDELFLIPAVCVSTVALLNVIKKPYRKLLVKYFRHNVRGHTIYFWLDTELYGFTLLKDLWKPLKPSYSFKFKKKYRRDGDIVWKLPLGGWFKVKGRVLTFKPTDHGSGWATFRVASIWEPINTCDLSLIQADQPQAPVSDFQALPVHLHDSRGNVVETTLATALNYIYSHHRDPARTLSHIFREHADLLTQTENQERLVDELRRAMECAIIEIEESQRFIHSKQGKLVRMTLTSDLRRLWPEYNERCEREEAAKQAVTAK